jgi:BioD-like phosphotransacetylase family protein
MEELVENLLVGAMNQESALHYFRRRGNKAVITGGDRGDIQLAALETSTKCLILTGNIRPGVQIVGLAEERSVPILLTRWDTMKAVTLVEDFFGGTRFHQKKKMIRFQQLLDEHLAFERLCEAIGLGSS